MGKKRIVTSGDGVSLADKKAGGSVAPKSSKKHIVKGVINVFSSYNNTIVSVCDQQGGVVVWTTAGSMGFRGARKSTPYAATIVAKEATERAKYIGLQEATVVIRGIGPGREAAIRGIAGTGIIINSIIDNTPQPHNGVRPKKPRRV